MKVRAESTRWAITGAGASTAPPWLPSALDSVTVDHDVRRSGQSRRRDGPAAARSDRAERVRLVDEQRRARLADHGGQLGQGRQIAVGAEDRVGHDDGAASRRTGRERLGDGLRIRVRGDGDLAAA